MPCRRASGIRTHSFIASVAQHGIPHTKGPGIAGARPCRGRGGNHKAAHDLDQLPWNARKQNTEQRVVRPIRPILPAVPPAGLPDHAHRPPGATHLHRSPTFRTSSPEPPSLAAVLAGVADVVRSGLHGVADPIAGHGACAAAEDGAADGAADRADGPQNRARDVGAHHRSAQGASAGAARADDALTHARAHVHLQRAWGGEARRRTEVARRPGGLETSSVRPPSRHVVATRPEARRTRHREGQPVPRRPLTGSSHRSPVDMLTSHTQKTGESPHRARTETCHRRAARTDDPLTMCALTFH